MIVFLLILALIISVSLMVLKHSHARQKNIKRMGEDVLKTLLHFSEISKEVSLKSLTAHLHLSQKLLISLLEHLEKEGLIKFYGSQILLTERGRKEALRLVRLHRLWEKYLSEETDLQSPEWHRIADQKEHETSEQEARELARKLGYPVLDPHGDPIPNVYGHYEKSGGIPLSQIKEPGYYFISHIEDEPQEVFQYISNQGLTQGDTVELKEIQNNNVQLISEGQQINLNPLYSSQIYVKTSEEPSPTPPSHTLWDIPFHQPARVQRLSHRCRGLERRRLLDLGIVPGTVIIPLFEAPGGEVRAFEILGTKIALRREQAQLIYVVPITDSQNVSLA